MEPSMHSSSAMLFEQNALVPYMRSELFANSPVTVFAGERDAVSVAKDLAEMKTAQGDNFPFFVMNMGRVEQLLHDWQMLLPRVQPFYALSCNSDPVLVRLLADQPDVGFFCLLRAQAELALELVPPERIVYGNPLWTRKNVRHACDSDLSLLAVDNEGDISRISTLHPHAKVILKVCMNPSVSGDSMMVFGCEALDEAPALLEFAASVGVCVVGISFSIGAGVSSLGIYGHAIAQCRELFDIGVTLGHPMSILDIGGGFPGIAATVGPSFAQVALSVSSALDLFFPEGSFDGLKVIAEPGRYFAASSFTLVTNVVDKQQVDASLITSVDLDFGLDGFVYQTNEGRYGSFGCRMHPNCEPTCKPLLPTDNALAESTYAAVLGPTLTNYDVVQPIAIVPEMQVGDWLLWMDLGAYSMGNADTLGEDGCHSPTVYYFTSNARWENMLLPSKLSVEEHGEESSGAEHRDADWHSLESTETASVLTEDEPFWMQGGHFTDDE